MTTRRISKWYVLCIILTCIILPNNAAHADLQFIDGIWFDQERIVTQETTRIYVAFRNNTDSDVTGIVTMYSNNIKIGNSTIAALPGRLIETWVDWTPTTAGQYTIRATLTNDDSETSDPYTTLERASVTVHPPIATSTQFSHDRLPASHSGLERFLPDNQFANYTAQLTGRIERTGNLLRAYEDRLQQRFDQRHQRSTSTNETAPEPIERVLQSDTIHDVSEINTFIWQPLQEWVVRNIQNAHISTISLFRWTFQNPMIVQVAILLGLLWLIFRTAYHFGARP